MSECAQLKIDFVNGIKTKPNRDKKSESADKLAEILKLGHYPNCFELIHNTNTIKPYFDIDVKKNTIADFDKVFTDRQVLLADALDWLRNAVGADSEFAVADASKEGVIVSYHIIITNRKTTMKTLNQFKTKLNYPFDSNPYIAQYDKIRWQKFRTIYASKEDEDRPLIPITFTNELYKHFVSNPDIDAVEWKVESKPKTSLEPAELKTAGIGNLLRQTDNRKEWFSIGIALYTIYGEQKGKEEFCTYSLNWKEFNSINFEKCWNDIIHYRYTNGGWSILKKYLDEDKWADFIPLVPPYIMNDKKTADWFFNHFNKYKIKYCDSQLYKFETHRWILLAEEELFRDVMNFISEAYDNLVATCDDDSKEKVKKLAHKAGMYSFINTIVKTIKNISCDSGFKDKLNQNRFLLGFENGVLDLKTKEFREGLPTDYITFSTGYEYQADYNEEKMAFVKNVIMNTMCDNEDRYKNLLTIIGRSMIGDNSISNQRFYCWYGGGKNGKSALQNLIDKTMGDYYKNPPTSLMTQNEQRSDGHNADIASLAGCRYCFLSETKDGYLNPQTLKKHTGENKLEYRAVYGRVKHSTKISWTPILVSNDKVKLNSDDFGIMRRFIYVPFKACFVDRPEDYQNNKDGKTYYKSIEDFDNIMQEHRNEFLHLILEYCNYGEKIKFCKEITEETNELIKSQDMLLDMLQALFIKVENDENPASHPTAISWDEMRKMLYDSRINPNAMVLKKWNLQTPDLLDKVKSRIEDEFGTTLTGKACGTLYNYTTHEGDRKKSRRLFYGITINTEEKDGDGCVF